MDSSQIFLLISLISFLFMVVTGVVSLFQPHDIENSIFFWTIMSEKNKYWNSILPVTMDSAILFISFSILLLLAVAAGIFIIIYKNDNNVQSGLFGYITRYHFIPILCASCLFIIGESFTDKNVDNNVAYIFSFIFSVTGLCVIIFIYFKTEISSLFYVRLVIKKGLYPCLMALFVYNICFTFGFYRIVKKLKDISEWDTLEDWIKGCSIAFCIIIGLINLVLSFVLKDICIAGMNFLIYLGLIIYFFKTDKDLRKEMNGETEGVIEIIMAILTITLIAFLIYKYKNTTLN